MTPSPIQTEGSERLESLKKEVDSLKTRFSEIKSNSFLAGGSQDYYQRTLASLVAEAKKYVKATKDFVKDVPLAEESLRPLIRTINACLRDGNCGKLRRSLKPNYEIMVSDESSLGDTQKYDPKSNETIARLTNEVNELTEKRIDLERMVETANENALRQKKEHQLALNDLINDCQELTNELKDMKKAKEIAEHATKRREDELKLRVVAVNLEKTTIRQELVSLIENSTGNLLRNYASFEKRLQSTDNRIAEMRSLIENRMKSHKNRPKSRSVSSKILLEGMNADLISKLNVEMDKNLLLMTQIKEEKDVTRSLSLRIEEIQMKLDNSKSQIEQLLFENEKIQSEKKSEIEQIAPLHNQKIESELASLRAKCAILESALLEKTLLLQSSAANHAAELVEKCTDYEDAIKSLQSDRNMLMDEIDKLKEEPRQPVFMESRRVESGEQGSDLSLQLSELQRSKEELLETSRRNESLERELERLQVSTLKMKGDQVHLEAELSKGKSARTHNELLRREIEKLNIELRAVREENLKLALKKTSNPAQITEAIEDYEQRINILKDQLKERVANIDNLQRTIDELKMDIEKKEDEHSSKLRIISVSLRESEEKRQSEIDEIQQLSSRIQSFTHEVQQICSESSLPTESLDSMLAAIRNAITRSTRLTHFSSDNISSRPRRSSDSKEGVVSRGVSPVGWKDGDCWDKHCQRAKKDLESLIERQKETRDELRSTQSQLSQCRSTLETERLAFSNQLHADKEAFELEMTHLKEEHRKQILEKEQYIAMLQAIPDFEPPLTIVCDDIPSPESSPENIARIEVRSASEEEKESSFHGNLQDLMNLTPQSEQIREKSDLSQVIEILQPVVSVYTTPGNAAWEVVQELLALRNEISLYRDKEESETVYPNIGQSLHSFGVSSNELPSHEDNQLFLKVAEMTEENRTLKAALVSEQNDVRRLEDMQQVLRMELKAMRSKEKDSILPHLKAAIVGLVGELPKLSQKGESMLRTIYSHFEFDPRQTSLLEQARKSKRSDKSALLAQVLL